MGKIREQEKQVDSVHSSYPLIYICNRKVKGCVTGVNLCVPASGTDPPRGMDPLLDEWEDYSTSRPGQGYYYV